VVSLNSRVFAFGIFELDTEALELRREGRLIHLRPQPARILSLMLKRSGRLVSREEITSELWPSDVDVDVEQGLNHCIKEIRAALGDRAEAPRYIQTLPRRGYRMLVEAQTSRETRPAASGPAEANTAALGPARDESQRNHEPREVVVTISVTRTGDHSLLWSTSLKRAANDIENIERDLRSAIASGIRPALEAESLKLKDRGGDVEGTMPLSRRGFE